MNRPSTAWLLHAAPPADLAALIGDLRALRAHGASDAETAAATQGICHALEVLSLDELAHLERAALGMPAGTDHAPASRPAIEDEDADPVGPPRRRSTTDGGGPVRWAPPPALPILDAPDPS